MAMRKKSKAEGLGRGATLAFPLGQAAPMETFPILMKAKEGWTQAPFYLALGQLFFSPKCSSPHLPGACLSLGPCFPTHLP